MYSEMLMTLLFLGLMLGVYMKHRSKMVLDSEKRYDLIIRFDDGHYIDIRKLNDFKSIAGWVRYGEYGFRGYSLLNKDLLEEFVMTTLNISKDSFKVISPTQLYMPS